MSASDTGCSLPSSSGISAATSSTARTGVGVGVGVFPESAKPLDNGSTVPISERKEQLAGTRANCLPTALRWFGLSGWLNFVNLTIQTQLVRSQRRSQFAAERV